MDRPGDKKNKVKTRKTRSYYDYGLLCSIIFLTIFGVIMIYSASAYTAKIKFDDAAYFMKKQAGIAAAGFVLMILISLVFDYHFFVKLSWIPYFGSYVLMAITMIFGDEINGRRRWLNIAGYSFQPTEVVKIALILFLSLQIVSHRDEMDDWSGLGKIFAFDLPLAGLVALNNLSSGIIIFMIAVIMTFVSTKKRWPYAVLLGIIVAALIFSKPMASVLSRMPFLKDYQINRILVWVDPEAHPFEGGYQVLQGLYAIGSGGFWGKGLGESIQKLGFIPESENDMIFSIICEELGILGALCVLFVFGYMLYRIFVIANKAPDSYGSYICIGVIAHIALQVILNIAVVCNAIPNTGVTLPFISYGGSSILILMCEMGLVLCVSRSIRLDQGRLQ